MRIFLAGSTGVIGRNLIPLLVAHRHDVIALVRTSDKTKHVAELGAKPVVANALDQDALGAAVREAEPDVIIHQLTSHGGLANFKKLDEDFRVTNRLRTEATDTMLRAARLVGTRRFIVQSFCGWPFARDGGPIKGEDDPLDPTPPRNFGETLRAIRHVEEAVRRYSDIEGIALRYGFLYGPGTSIADDGEMVELIRKRQFPVVGNGAGVWSFTHVEDAARAAVAAVARGDAGLYNVVDDEPAPVSAWLPFLAHTIGAQPPRRIPAWLAKPVLGEGGLSMMTETRGGSNTKAKHALGWAPKYTSWRSGFVRGLR